ncbi:hypothetical protein VB776_13170 [Arcicella sp. DC2W]|uniref:Uncharacterized protein n=1 Tax=Arcicella gelida TaxID=2984195 RepID=A0ABU5S5V7_9BACT|nr:hypothetical protein [Arcicella sp. DC2W]MEA5403872.1 hypothetical protein [Arcicella sp. DC2W]
MDANSVEKVGFETIKRVKEMLNSITRKGLVRENLLPERIESKFYLIKPQPENR